MRDEARATVLVTPIPPEKKPKPPTVLPAPKAVPKKALSGGTLLAGGLVLLATIGNILFAINKMGAPTPTPQVIKETVVVEKEVEVTKEVPVEVTAAPAAKGRLDVIKERGKLTCGCNAELPGFGYLSPQDELEGFDIDFCKALAAAVFGDPEAVEYRPLTAPERLPALQAGEVDVLIRNTAWTLTRDAERDLNWAGVNFYDGQSMMVRKESDLKTLEDMEGATICVTAGTTTEINLADAFRMRGLDYTPLLFEGTQDTWTAYEDSRCDGMTSDKSQLAALRWALANPEEHIILDVTISKEPLGPLTAHGADEWNDVVRWVLWGMIQAEESGVSSENVDEMLKSEDLTIQRLLGGSGEMGTALGIPDDFMVQVLKAVGNYGEVYERWLGPDGLDIPRGPNELWTKGGLMYSMVFR